MSDLYRRIIKSLSPVKILVVTILLWLFWLMSSLPVWGYHRHAACMLSEGCIRLRFPNLISLLDKGPTNFYIYNLELTTLFGGLWLYGMVSMLLVMEKKNIHYQENPESPEGFELVEHKK